MVLCLLPAIGVCQKTVQVISSDRSEFREEWGVERIYHPVFLHEGSTLSADSADYDDQAGFFDAKGNVVITQPNGTIVYSDKLHYIKATRIAILTNNVRMVDKQSVLTTNHLTYNLNSKIGTYTGGGRIVNTTDTLTSKNGYYFENSQDAYFRYNVVVRTPNTQIYTDTLRYNSYQKLAYFYGPTNIKGNNEGNLYTESGTYQTETDYARFGKNNLYTEGSKFLTGDSLYYDGKAGRGRAVRHVEFVDTAEKMIMKGELGLYRQEDESITMTQNAYLTIVTNADSTMRDSVENDSMPGDSIRPIEVESKADSAFMSADTLFSKVLLLKDYSPIALNLRRDGGEIEDEDEISDLNGDGRIEEGDPIDDLASTDRVLGQTLLGADTVQAAASDPTAADPLRAISDSLSVGLDSLQLEKNLSGKDSIAQLAPMASVVQDTLKKQVDSLTALVKAVKIPSKVTVDIAKKQKDTASTSLRADIGMQLRADSILMIQAVIPKEGDADSTLAVARLAAANRTPQAQDSVRAVSDTAKTRIVMAYHNMRIYKSDLQARADSAFYGYADSVIRCYGSPMIWAQGSQLSADTIYLQLKNQQLDNMLLQRNAFIINTEGDSVKFNQIKGRKISGFFKDNKLQVMYIDGNAQSNYYDIEKNNVKSMISSLSSRKKVLLENNEVSEIVDIRKAESTYYPLSLIPEEKEILPGFIWKPENRPQSKEDVILGIQHRATSDAMNDERETKTDKANAASTLTPAKLDNTGVQENPKKP